ncbi:hepatoma-derived growth factor-related protein 2 isoform X2 [Adelges cooleyi]|nr:hepatoma-derived growth factor-related protein 2 isoform X2 [Adelges cooleyi]XP_050428385.1 hepatoma-derived growth factor-related protein 2 isoform X2 [Adelges cooleyi]
MSSKKVYSIKDKVFAKVRGYPAWPAVISGVEADTPSRQRYHVYFYGTGERAVCKSDELFPYEENKSKLGKPNKRKHFSEALMQIENDTECSVITEDTVQAFQASSSIDQSTENDTIINESETNTETEKNGELNSESEGKLTIDESSSSKGKKSIGPKKSLGLSLSKTTKRKLSDGKLESPAKKLMTTKTKELESVSDLPIMTIACLKENTNSVSEGKTCETNELQSEPQNVSDSVLETSEVSFDNNKSSKHNSKIKSSPISSGDMSSNSSNIGQVSRSGRKIKPKKYTDYENDAEVPKRSRLSKDMSKNSEKINGSVDADNSSEQNEMVKGSSSELVNKTKSHSTTPIINDSVSKEMKQISKKINQDDELPANLKNLMKGAIDHLDVEWSKVTTSKAVKVECLTTEVDLLDCVYHLRMALRTDKADCDKAIKILDQMAELKINTLMLKKHSEVVDTVKKVTMYIGNRKEWETNDEEANEMSEKTAKVRRKANMVFNKFRALFTVPDGQSFLDTFKKEVDDFYTKTKHLACDQIYGLISEKQLNQ